MVDSLNNHLILPWWSLKESLLPNILIVLAKVEIFPLDGGGHSVVQAARVACGECVHILYVAGMGGITYS